MEVYNVVIDFSNDYSHIVNHVTQKINLIIHQIHNDVRDVVSDQTVDIVMIVLLITIKDLVNWLTYFSKDFYNVHNFYSNSQIFFKIRYTALGHNLFKVEISFLIIHENDVAVYMFNSYQTIFTVYLTLQIDHEVFYIYHVLNIYYIYCSYFVNFNNHLFYYKNSLILRITFHFNCDDKNYSTFYIIYFTKEIDYFTFEMFFYLKVIDYNVHFNVNIFYIIFSI